MSSSREQHAKGIRVIVYYVLETPVYEYIDLPNLSAVKYTTIITAMDTKVEASNIESLYYKGRKLEKDMKGKGVSENEQN